MPQDPTLARWATQREPSATEIFQTVQQGHQINLLRKGQELQERKLDIATTQAVEGYKFKKEQDKYERDTRLMSAKLRMGLHPETGEPLPLSKEAEAEHAETMARIQSQLAVTEKSMSLVAKQMEELKSKAMIDLQRAETAKDKAKITLFNKSIDTIKGLMTSPYAQVQPEKTEQVIRELNKITSKIAGELGYEYAPIQKQVETVMEQKPGVLKRAWGWLTGGPEQQQPKSPLAESLKQHQQQPEVRIKLDDLVNFEKKNQFDPNILPPSKRGAGQQAKATWETEIAKQSKKWYTNYQTTGDLPTNRDVQNFLILLKNKVQPKGQ